MNSRSNRPFYAGTTLKHTHGTAPRDGSIGEVSFRLGVVTIKEGRGELTQVLFSLLGEMISGSIRWEVRLKCVGAPRGNRRIVCLDL